MANLFRKGRKCFTYKAMHDEISSKIEICHVPRDERKGRSISTMATEYNGLRHKSSRQSLGKGSNFLQKMCIKEPLGALEGVH